MDAANAADSPLEAAAGVAGSAATAAFELLGHETRLAILLTLWEAHDPHAEDCSVPYSDLFDRVAIRDSGNFTYHLDRLRPHFVERTADGYELRNAGCTIVQAVIAGSGLDEAHLPPTEIDMACYRCGAPVELSYQEERLYHVCTECEGNTGPDSPQDRPVGTLMAWDFDPAGLAHRTAAEVFVAAAIASLREFGLLVRGLCPACSGAVESEVDVCDAHVSGPGEACGACGTPDEVRVRYRCSVCKYGDAYPADAAVYDHPDVVAFCHEHDIGRTYDLDGPEACASLLAHLAERDHELVAEDPVRIRVTVPGGGETLALTMDADLDVVAVTRDRE